MKREKTRSKNSFSLTDYNEWLCLYKKWLTHLSEGGELVIKTLEINTC